MVAREDEELKALLEKFVCVRAVQMGSVDLNLFQFFCLDLVMTMAMIVFIVMWLMLLVLGRVKRLICPYSKTLKEKTL